MLISGQIIVSHVKHRTYVIMYIRAPLGNFVVPGKCFSHIKIDFIGPLPQSSGFTYLLTVVDKTTRWPKPSLSVTLQLSRAHMHSSQHGSHVLEFPFICHPTEDHSLHLLFGVTSHSFLVPCRYTVLLRSIHKEID